MFSDHHNFLHHDIQLRPTTRREVLHAARRIIPFAIIGLPTLARATHQPTVSLTRGGPENRYVLMRTSKVTVAFDTWYGGAPLLWIPNGLPLVPANSIIDPFPGVGKQVTYETGQDTTQASANGLTDNRIRRLDGAVPLQGYYMSETRFERPRTSITPAIYEVSGTPPFFWASLDPEDDSIPVIRRGEVVSYQDGWLTKYHPGDKPGSAFHGLGVPIWFRGGPAERVSGILMVGNEMKAILHAAFVEIFREAVRLRLATGNGTTCGWSPTIGTALKV